MKTLILGYSRKLKGGVTQVTNVLLENMPEVELHPVIHCYAPKAKSFLLTLQSFFLYLLKILLNRKQLTIIHVIVGSSGDALRTLPFLYVARLFNLGRCIQFHKSADVIRNGISSRLLSKLIFSEWDKIDMHVFLSKRLLGLHRECVGEAANAVVIPNALEEGWLSLNALPLSERTRDIVFLGRWSWEKGVDDLVAAMAELQSESTCEFYSDAPAETRFKNCQFFTWASEGEVREIIRSAKVVVLASYAEAYPTVLLEAAACGTPFVATNIAGIPDIAFDSGGGLLVDSGDVRGLTSQLERLLTDVELWNRCSHDGKQWSSTLSVNEVRNKWRTTYALLCPDVA